LESINFAITVTIMGMGITFLVLILLSLILATMNKVWDRFSKEESAPQQEVQVSKPVKQEQPVVPSTAARLPAEPAIEAIPGSVVAAITAALAAILGEDSPDVQVTGVRRVGTTVGSGVAWSQAGRNEIINTRQRYFERKGR